MWHNTKAENTGKVMNVRKGWVGDFKTTYDATPFI